MSHRNGPVNLHYHNAIKSTITSAVYTPSTNIVAEPLTEKYIVGENIGRGKFAVVRKCTHKQTNEVVAAKFIKKRRRGKSCREEILREVVMLEMALDHPRLVNLKEVYETQQELILITEYCAGGELFTECILEEKFDESDVRLLMAQILEGLVYLHEKNIVHLDLKPQNILLTDEFPKGSVKICDLGFACLVNTGEDIRDIIGTPDYVAPEVLNYDPLGLYTDMWSLGVLTYVMLTTCSPFAAEDKQMTFSNITTVNFDFPEELFSNISAAAQDFIQKLLLSEPGERMTAKECFDHEWLQGVFHLKKALTSCDSDNQENSSSDQSNSIPRNQSLGVLFDNDIGYSDDMNISTANESDNSDCQLESSSRNKVVEQSSEMSVREDEGVSLETESNSQSLVKFDDMNEPVNDSCDTESLSLQNPPVTTILSEESHIVNDNVSSFNVMSSVDITTDTDSNVLMSVTKLLESDSGMVTGSECRSVESANLSGRTSTEPDFSETTRNDINDDFEMQNKGSFSERASSIEDVRKEFDKDVDTGCDDNFESVVSDMDIEQTGNVTDPEILQMNENNSAKNVTMQDQITNDMSDNDSCSQDIFNSSTFSDSVNDNQMYSVNDEHSSPIFGNFNNEIKYANTPTPLSEARPHLNSVGNIDDSINSMQLGERHKRGMCNDPNLSGADNPDTEEPEYEFVSVSKRVRSIEEANTIPGSPDFSPKIARSPKIGRNSRFHPHQHH